jgi:sugar phosphate isomerase/epimerase
MPKFFAMKFYISSSCSSQSILVNVLNELIELGFRHIELTGNIEYCKDVEKVVGWFKKEKGCDFSLHNYIPFWPEPYVINLASTDINAVETTLEHIRRAVSLLKALGKNLYSLHPGYRYDLLPVLEDNYFKKASLRTNRREDFFSMLEMISTIILEKDFCLAIENLHPKCPEYPFSFLCSPDDIIFFLDHVKNKNNIGLLLDLGHINVASYRLGFDKYEFLYELFSCYSEKIFQIHLSENDGTDDAHGICGCDSWQVRYLYDNRKCLSSDIPVTLEWSSKWKEVAFPAYHAIIQMFRF